MEFGSTALFSDVSFVVSPKERIALVGKNGAGKSTLLKLMSGEIQPTSGTVDRMRDLSVGYLAQVMKLQNERTVMEEAMMAFADVAALEQRAAALSTKLAERTDYDSPAYMNMAEEVASLSERLSLMAAAGREANAERTLKGLGFSPNDFNRPTSELSGGWRMRIELAKILLMSPDVMLLDEPTNHLDIESIRWLERWLKTARPAVVLVSHDRAFLNNVCNRTIELSVGRAWDYKVKYDDYVILRQERREAQLRAYENQQREIADIESFVERFRYKATKAVQVQSRLKQLEKMERIEVDEVDNTALHLRFPPCERSGDFPVICNEVAKSYGEHRVIEHVNLTIRRGEKVAFVGRNGEGKSTLVKCIMGQLDHEGELKIGHNVHIGYYAQNQAQLLDDGLTVFDTIDQAARGDVRLKIRDILGAFMFGGEASEKKVGVLSGGERSRLAMIKLLLEPVNFLILDEPTNHLDMRTKDVLKEALMAFDGTLIIVSHDRYFLDGLAERIYEFGGGKVREHIGTIYEYLARKEAAEQLEFRPQGNKRTDAPPATSEGGQLWQAQKEKARALKRAENAVAAAEEKISKIESEIAAVEQSLAKGATDMKLFEEHGRLQHYMEQALKEWETAQEALEKL